MTTKAGITEGTWITYTWVVNDIKGRSIAVCDDRDSTQEQRANARAISAVPDMLEALQDLVDIVEIVGECPSLTKARAALAKASGETP